MNSFIVAQKVKQEQAFDAANRRIVTTILTVEPTYVGTICTPDKEGYWGIQLAYGKAKAMKNVAKPQQGKLKKAGIETPLRFLREVRTDETTIKEKQFAVGQHIKASEMFKADDMVVVQGTSKGKGFQGVVRRHGFAGGPKTHGQSDRHRSPGSIGQRMTPGRVFKGLRMAGRTGNETVTVKGLRILSVTDDQIVLAGLVPGGIHSTVLIYA